MFVELAKLLDALSLGLRHPCQHKHHCRQVTHAEQSKGSRLAQRRFRREEKLGDYEGAGPQCGDGDGGGQGLGAHGEQLPEEYTKDGGAPWPRQSYRKYIEFVICYSIVFKTL